MREFPERFGDSERMDLETTVRCSEPITAVATRFVLENPAQISKKCVRRGSCKARACNSANRGARTSPC